MYSTPGNGLPLFRSVVRICLICMLPALPGTANASFESGIETAESSTVTSHAGFNPSECVDKAGASVPKVDCPIKNSQTLALAGTDILAEDASWLSKRFSGASSDNRFQVSLGTQHEMSRSSETAAPDTSEVGNSSDWMQSFPTWAIAVALSVAGVLTIGRRESSQDVRHRREGSNRSTSHGV